ncbi:MAG: glycosyltransferase family 4 protein [Deltaproteobacteria bacterium]|nr:glycosyltransferase family 4 protein [Deltaproteobacteria bacterium]
MKILLSAYACEPNKGSEPGVGWHWAIELARLGHEVFVLTRANNRPVIEDALRKKPVTNIRFIYYDLPDWARFWKKGQRGVHLYYLLWQWGAYRVAKLLHANELFDYVHHITFGVVRHPSFMGNLGIPFIFGPLGGGERTPWRLRWGYGLRGILTDALRDILNLLIKIDPLMLRAFQQASIIYVKTPQSRTVIPRRFWSKTKVMIEIGVNLESYGYLHTGNTDHSTQIRILYVGRFLYLKGMHLGLRAFAELLKISPDARLTLVGNGPDERRWHFLSDKLPIAGQINWVPWMHQDDLNNLYRQHDVFLFPSLHDSSGNVVLEAMAFGLPVVCLDLGGPGVIVDEICGWKVSTEGKTADDVVNDLAEGLIRLAGDDALRERYGKNAAERIQTHFTWERVVRNVYADVSDPIDQIS